MMLRTAVFVLLLAIIPSSIEQNSTCLSSDGIQDMRLVDGTYGDFMGRVEIRYNGTWGTICDDLWSLSDADVVCRMMGFSGGGCAVSRAGFGQGPSASPIWLDNVRCTGNENCLGDCNFIGLDEPVRFCSHREDAGVVCLSDESAITPPDDLTFLNSTTTTLAFQFSAITTSQLPRGATNIRYRLSYTDEDGFTRNSYYFTSRSNRNQQIITRVLTNLRRDKEYSVRLSVDYRYSSRICFSYISGPLSDAVVVRTNATARPSSVQVRLSSPRGGSDFMGRVEVFYNGTWGTVCDDAFSTTDANVFCRALGFDRALCVPFFSRAGPGSGPIWLDNLACPSSAEIIEDCSHPGWGVHNCRHTDDAEVVCQPMEDYLEKPSRPNITDVKATSAVISWENYDFPDDDLTYFLQVLYRPVGRSFRSTRTVSRFSNEVTLTRLLVNVTYEVTIRVQSRITACFFSAIYGEESDATNFTTVFSSPEGPPTNFHVIALNSTAVEVEWDAPLFTLRSGDILGYTLSVLPAQGGTVDRIDFPVNSTNLDVVTVLSGLAPSTSYSFSVLAYNQGGSGPSTLFLMVKTFAVGQGPIISRFGVNGNSLDRGVFFTFQRDIRIHCGSSQNNLQIDWLTPSREKVGTTNRNLREAHYNNGTTVLQIAAFRRLSTCDGGVYTCVANNTMTGQVHRKNFTLLIGSIPARPNRPEPGLIMSNSIQIFWEASLCTGGHKVIEYNIQYYERTSSFFNRIIQSVRHIDASQTNYTIKDLQPSTTYIFQVQSVSSDLRTSAFSLTRSIITLPPAPSFPRHISVRIVSVQVVEVSWRPPATPNGVIIRYTVYLIPLISGGEALRQKRQAVQGPDIIVATFPGTATSGNVTVPSTNVDYSVQVTASIDTGEELNEGESSFPVNISLPDPELPIPQNIVRIGSTNSSITLQWDLPPPPFLPVEEFRVTYRSRVQATTPKGQIIDFFETGIVGVAPSQRSVVISPLTPGTEYTFTVEARSQQMSQRSASIKGSTLEGSPSGGRLAFFQVKFGPVDKCSSFQAGNINERIALITSSLVQELNKLCSCGLTTNNLQNGTFSCDGLVNQVAFHGRILGNDRYSAGDLASLLQTWVASETAALRAGSFRFRLDSTCSSFLDSLDDSTCPTVKPPTARPSTSAPSPSAVESGGVSTGEAVTIIVGFCIVLILVAVIILLSIQFFRKQKWNGSRFHGAVRFRNDRAPKEDKEPFASIGPADQDRIAFDSDSESKKTAI